MTHHTELTAAVRDLFRFLFPTPPSCPLWLRRVWCVALVTVAAMPAVWLVVWLDW